VATLNKDFKVKNGLIVGGGGSFTGTVTIAEPTLGTHATTKDYVDLIAGSSSMIVSNTSPEGADEGNLWFDTLTERVHVYYSNTWVALATLKDAEVLQDHIHDTSIDGSGLIISTFVSGGSYNEPGYLVSGGFYDTEEFEAIFDGGVASDNFS
jgi:uncharacterized protein YodC (DUF2158 family)